MRFRTFPTGLVALILLAGCTTQGPASPAPGGSAAGAAQPTGPKRISIAIKGNPPTLNDKINSSGSGGVPGVAEASRLIHVGLAVPDEVGALQARLAEAVPTVDNGNWRVLPDGRMETTWRIREGARWHDGTPFTADDLAFTAVVERDKELPQFDDRAFQFLEGVDVVDARTVTAHWNRPYIEADAMFTEQHLLPLPKHLLEQAYNENKAGFIDLPYWTQNFVGTGPYRIRDWVPGSHMLLVANDSYVLGQPIIREVEVQFIDDPNTMIAGLMAGTVDGTIGRGLALDQADTIRQQRPEIQLQLAVAGCLCAFPQYLNPNPAAIADPQFRRALMYGLDRQELANSLMQGLVPAAHVFVGPNEPEYKALEPSIVRYEYDPRRTAQLLEGMGYTKTADGFYHDAAGQKLSIEIRTTSSVEIGKGLLLAVADSYQRIGIGVDPVLVSPQQATDREYRANFPGFDLVNQPSNLTLLNRFLGRESSLPENNYRGNNRMRYVSPELDTLIDRYFTTVPMNERVQTASLAIAHITDRVVNLSMLYNANLVLASSRLNGITATNSAWNSHVWDIS